MTVQTVHEPELLGTAGTLLANQEFFEGGTGLLIHADNAMAGDVKISWLHTTASGLLPTHHADLRRPTPRAAAGSLRLTTSRLSKHFMRK